MSDFTFYSTTQAPGSSRPLLEQAEKRLGFLPNLYAGLAESPAALEGYFALSSAFSTSDLSPVEQQVILLTVSFENRCTFCMAAHSMVAKMAKMSGPTLDALRSDQPLGDPKLNALREFTRLVVRRRGFVSPRDVEKLLSVGYTHANVLDVVLGVAMKTLSNYANHILETPLNPQFESERWAIPTTPVADEA